MTRANAILVGSAVLVALLLAVGCSLLPQEEAAVAAGWSIQLRIQAPTSREITSAECEVTGLNIQVLDSDGLPVASIDWAAEEGAKSYDIPVPRLGQYQLLVTHFGERDGEQVQASESATFKIQAMKITVIDIVPGCIGLIPVTPGGAVVTTLAGTAGTCGSADGTGAAAQFWCPSGITTDGTSLFVADCCNHTIRRVVIATGEVTTLAGAAGAIGSDDGTGAEARFYYPNDITTDGTNLYVTDWGNHTIRKVVIATGEVSTLAGTAGAVGSDDGMGAEARFNGPGGITTDGTNLYVTDTGNHTIRKVVIAMGAVTTLAGMPGVIGSDDGTGAEARFYYPVGIATDGANLYVGDCGNNTIRKVVIATRAVTTLAGTPGAVGSDDGVGAEARFNHTSLIATDGANLYVADKGNHIIRKVVIATGVVTTLAGKAGVIGSDDGTGAEARFNNPEGVTTDGANLYVGDGGNNTIRVITK